MMKISLIVLIFSLLSNYGSTKPAEVIEADLSISEEIIDSYDSELISSLDISDNVGLLSSNMESMVDMATESMVDIASGSMVDMATESMVDLATESMVETEALMGRESLLGMESLMNPESIIDNVQSSIYDATSMAAELVDYTNMIDNSPFMSLTDKAQYLRQLASFSEDQMGMASGLLGMLGGGFISHMQWKVSVIRAAKEQLALAMQALTNGDMDAVRMHVLEAIHTMQEMCPICQALKFALNNNDSTMLSFAGNMGMSILGQMESMADLSISD